MEVRQRSSALGIAILLAISTAVSFEIGDVRLQDGHSAAEGRVEVYHDGEWGTICDDGFDLQDAHVICRQLGFSSANASHCCAHFTHGSGAIKVDDLACEGTESRVSDCAHRGWGEHNCAHTEDASVTCNGNIRLAGRNNTIQGRVEVFIGSTWGTICDSGWDLLDGDLVCKQLGLPGANSTLGGAEFGPGSGPVALSDIACTEDDEDFFNCTMNKSPGPECNHSRDASVNCRKPVRLVGGRNPHEGYVEIYNGVRWGPICAQNWGIEDARVVCNQIGELAAAEASGGMRFGRSSSRYMMSNVGCTGLEEALDQCPFTDTGDEDCSRFVQSTSNSTLLSTTSNLAGVQCMPAVRLVAARQKSFLEGEVEVFVDGQWGKVCGDSWDSKDAGVVCRQLGDYPLSNVTYKAVSAVVDQPVMAGLDCEGSESRLQDCRAASVLPTQCQPATAKCQVTIRLIGGGHSLEGNVEIAHRGEWGNICDDNWGIEDAKVVCRQLGNYEVVSYSCCSKYAPPNQRYHLDDIGCSGDEGRVEDCYHSDWGTHNCGNGEAAGVSCRNLRLVTDEINTRSPKGRVEVVLNGRWGRVCGNNWDMQDADVLCRQLYNSTVESLGTFASRSALGFLTDFACVGNEKSLMACPHREIEEECQSDATVVCRGGLRLIGGRSPLEGRVEIFHDGQWGTVCDDSWDINDGIVVCRQLGNYAALSVKCCQAYGQGSGPILMDGVDCDGTESILENCPHEGWQTHNCQHFEDASVICTDIRLTHPNGTTSTSQLEGRVEILMDNEWKSVCNTGWDKSDAQVVCTQLFNTDVKDTASFPVVPGRDTGLTNVKCRGNETMLASCPSTKADFSCVTPWRAGVQCKDIRLIGGKRESEGAVETLVDMEWGLICGKDWGVEEGKVACRQLGFCKPITTMKGWEPKIDEHNVMHWHSMNCTGNEERLLDCPKSRGAFPCNNYNFEAAVVCQNWCNPPSLIHHGSWYPRRDEYAPRSRISFTCERGYEIKGRRMIECLDVCEWNAAFPKCVESATEPGGGGPSNHASSGVHPAGLFFLGLFVGILIVAIVCAVVLYMKRMPRNQQGKTGNIFRPRRRLDEMEEPVLRFRSNPEEHDEENGDTM